MIFELMLVAASIPPVVKLLGPAWVGAAIIEGVFFLFRSISALLLDARHRQEDITAFSTIETINVIPVGILYLDLQGCPLLMNRCMRSNLTGLHLPTDLRDMSETWNKLRKLGAKESDGKEKAAVLTLRALVTLVRLSRSRLRRFVCSCVTISPSRAVRSSGLSVST